MKKSIAALVVMVATIAIPSIGLSFPSLGGVGVKLGGNGDLSGQQSSLVSAYVAADKDVLSSQSKLLQALGLKDQAAAALATANALGAGPTEHDLDAANKAQTANSTALAEAQKNGSVALDDQAKKAYAQGLVLLAAGLIKYTGMRQDVANFSRGLTGPGALQAATKLQAGAFIVKTLPSSISNTTATLGSAVDFAKSHGIEIPPDATAAL